MMPGEFDNMCKDASGLLDLDEGPEIDPTIGRFYNSHDKAYNDWRNSVELFGGPSSLNKGEMLAFIKAGKAIEREIHRKVIDERRD